MNLFLMSALSLPLHNTPLIASELNSSPSSITEKKCEETRIEDQIHSLIQQLAIQLDPCLNPHLKDRNQWKGYRSIFLEDLIPGDLILFGSAENDIQTIGILIGDNEFIHIASDKNVSDLDIHHLSDCEWDIAGSFPYRIGLRLDQEDKSLEEEPFIQRPEEVAFSANEMTETSSFVDPAFLDGQFACYFINEQNMPLVISPKGDSADLTSFQIWAEGHQQELGSLLKIDGALLLRDFPVATAEQFASIIQSILGRKLMDYRGGEGSRKKVAEGVYTSTEAPPEFHIPLHHELSCSNYPPDYICFYCEIAPDSGSGQTLLGKTDSITQEILLHPKIWNFFNEKKLKYISRHPPAGSFFSKVNQTHKTWQDVFETNDKIEVERICQLKGLKYQWLGDWIEVARVIPAIQGPDFYFDHPYWFNQAHLYHANPRIRGGWINHILANLLYLIPSTKQYDVTLEDGSPIPKEIIYGIYDILEHKTIKFDWQKGDVLIIDNRRALHGRASYSGARRILASMVP